MIVLVAEDDRHILNGVCELLQDEGYQTLAARDGEQALALFRQHKPDFVILDIMMPKRDGYSVCREIRGSDRAIPIIFLSAKSEEIDKVLGLELGADDYVMKPFGAKEFLARVRAVSRRCGSEPRRDESASPAFVIGELTVFPQELRCRRGDETIDLGARDVKILETLLEHRGKVLDRNTLFNLCWGMNYFPNSRTLDQHISQLRKKIERDPREPEIIKTVHGVGYRYDG